MPLTPYSPLNQYNAKPLGRVVQPAKDPVIQQKNSAPSAIDQLPIFKDQNDFMAEQKVNRLAAETFTMAKASYSVEKVKLYTYSDNAQALENSMGNLLQSKYLGADSTPVTAKPNLSPEESSSLQLLKSLHA